MTPRCPVWECGSSVRRLLQLSAILLNTLLWEMPSRERREKEQVGTLTHCVCHTLCSMPAIEHGMPSPLRLVKLPTPTSMHVILVTCANVQNVWVLPFDVHAVCSIGESWYLENRPLSHSISYLSCHFDLKLKELANLALLNDTFCMQHTPWTIVLSIHCG